MFGNLAGHCFILVLSALVFTTLGCSESLTGGSQDAAVQTDVLAQDMAVPDSHSDTAATDTGQQLDGTEETLEDSLVEDTQDDDIVTEDALIADSLGKDTSIDDAPLADTQPEDAPSPEDVPEDVEKDVPTPPFNQPVEISEGTGYESGELHELTVSDAGNVSIFWRGKSSADSVDLVVSQSDPMGNAFGPPSLVKEGLKTQMVGVGGDMVQHFSTFYFVWRDEADDGDHLITFRRTDSADFAGDDVTIDSAAAPIALWRPQLLRSESGTVCVIWERKNGQAFDVMLRCSLDDGVTWEDAVQVDDSNGQSATVSSATFNTAGSLVVAVQVKSQNAQHIMVKVSDDLGVNWTQATTVDGIAIQGGLVSEALNESGNLKPSLVHTTTGNLKLAWHKPTGGGAAEAYLSSSSDGLSWTAPALIPGGKVNISLVIGRGSDLHASSVESILGQGDTLYMSSPDEGEIWGASNPIPKTMNSTLIDHRMGANLVHGWLHIAWWESLPGNLLKQKLVLMTVDGP